MDKHERILGRRLAVEETKVVSGAQRAVSTIVDIEDQETSPLNDQTQVASDSGTVTDTGPFADSGTVDDTGALQDCAGSGTTREVCLSTDP